MKKFYLTVAFSLCFIAGIFAQTRYWVGPATGGNWNNTANWSATSNGAGGQSVPNSNTFNVIFDQAAEVHLDLATLDLLGLAITNNIHVKLWVNANTVMNLYSNSTTPYALNIQAGSTLTDSTFGDYDFQVYFEPASRGLVAGTWRLNGSVEPFDYYGPYLNTDPTTSSLGTRVDITGKVYVGNAFQPSGSTWHQYINFRTGSEYHIDGNINSSPNFNYEPNSTIRITGRVNSGPSFSGSKRVAGIVYNSPTQAAPISLALINRNIVGSINVENTNGEDLTLFSNGNAATVQTIENTVSGNINTSGNSNVLLSNVGTNNKIVNIRVSGDVNAGGNMFDIQKHGDNGEVINKPTTLFVGGNINHTAGIFTATSPKTNGDVDLFIIEMNGTVPQTISSVTGNFDNARRMVTLRMNNPSGVTLLTPLTIGRLSFASDNKGVLNTTNTNILTIMNNSAGTMPVNSPADNGYVSGPLRRRTAAAGNYEIPVGKNGKLRMPEILTADATESYYNVEYFDNAYADLSVAPPVRGVSTAEYWIINKESGGSASVRLFLNGAVPGAISSDAIFVGRYNGSDWVSAKGTNGTMLTPGTVTTGYVTSDETSSFSPFTLVYGSQGALPVNLLSFNGKKLSSGRSQLTWSVSSHEFAQRFEVQRSADGKSFATIGTVNGIASNLQYEFTDAQMTSGHNFYRLKMFDLDGAVNYSKVITLMNGVKGFYITSMMPTLVQDRARINISASEKGNVQLVVTDMAGRIVYQQMAKISSENEEIWINLSTLAGGAYQLSGYLNHDRSAPVRFIKK